MDTKELQAGLELDALIADKVMGTCHHPKGECNLFAHPPYSTKIAAAWEVVEFLRKEGCDFDSFSSSTRLQAGWSDVVFMSQVDESFARAETLPLAICRAALLTVEKIR